MTREVGWFSTFLYFATLLGVLPSADAVPVEVEFRGRITSVTAATDTTADLSGDFSPGQTMTIVYLVEMSTPGQNAFGIRYYNDAVRGMQLTVGIHSYTISSNSFTQVAIGNDVLGMGDSYWMVVAGLVGPGAQDMNPVNFSLQLHDEDGSVWTTDDLPAPFSIDAFELASWRLVFGSLTATGWVDGALSIQAVTWSKVKALYVP